MVQGIYSFRISTFGLERCWACWYPRMASVLQSLQLGSQVLGSGVKGSSATSDLQEDQLKHEDMRKPRSRKLARKK